MVRSGGHGGVGKDSKPSRASVRTYAKNERREFGLYSVSHQQKDRAYSYFTGEIVRIDEPVDSYASLVKLIKATMRLPATTDIDGIKKFFLDNCYWLSTTTRTYPPTEREQIEKIYWRNWNISSHKVLITTRARITIGEEFPTHETQCARYNKIRSCRHAILKHPNHEFIGEKALNNADMQQRVLRCYKWPSIVHISVRSYMGAGLENLEKAVSKDIKNSERSGRIFCLDGFFNYLSSEAKYLFRIISLLVTDSDLTNFGEQAPVYLQHGE